MSNKRKTTSANWTGSTQQIKAIQVAFELGDDIPDYIREQAVLNGITPSDQIRKIIGLPCKKIKRPRLTLSLRPEDYEHLSDKYGLATDDKAGIRTRISQELEAFYKKQQE